MTNADSYGLQYSNYISTPSYYASQNCYGFVLGKIINADPGYRTGSTYNSRATFKACVISDLNSLGYSVSETDSPTASLASNQFMIAYCIGTWGGTDFNGNDHVMGPFAYHFWRRNYNQTLFNHKYSTSSGIMRFNYQPKSENRYYTTDESYNGITMLSLIHI